MADDWTERASKDRSKTMTSKAILSHRFAKYIISAYTMSVGSLTISNLLAVRSAGYEQPIEERLLFKMTLPFECGASPFYEIVLVTQFLLQYTLALMAAMLNALMVTLVSWFRYRGTLGVALIFCFPPKKRSKPHDNDERRFSETRKKCISNISFSKYLIFSMMITL